jgi:hypothetical protein
MPRCYINDDGKQLFSEGQAKSIAAGLRHGKGFACVLIAKVIVVSGPNATGR